MNLWICKCPHVLYNLCLFNVFFFNSSNWILSNFICSTGRILTASFSSSQQHLPTLRSSLYYFYNYSNTITHISLSFACGKYLIYYYPHMQVQRQQGHPVQCGIGMVSKRLKPNLPFNFTLWITLFAEIQIDTNFSRPLAAPSSQRSGQHTTYIIAYFWRFTHKHAPVCPCAQLCVCVYRIFIRIFPLPIQSANALRPQWTWKSCGKISVVT